MDFCCSIVIGHWVKTIGLGLGTTFFDVYTDVGTGLYHYFPKNVTRYLDNSTVVPDYCSPSHQVNATGVFDCMEEDTAWATITFTLIQLPAYVLALCAVIAALIYGCDHGFETSEKKVILGSILGALFIPFPVTVFIQQVASLFVVNAQMELMSAIFLFGEGSLEASPQLLLSLYIILSDSERKVATIQILSIVSSILSISKTSIELYLNESYGTQSSSRDVLDHTDTNDDSMMKDRSLFEKLKLMAEFSPAFLFSLIFKVGSIAIICALLKEYSAIYLGLGICITFIVALFFSNGSYSREKRIGSALFYCLTNVTILAKCPLGTRNDNDPQMKAVSVTWWILHTLTLIVLMIWFGAMDLSTHRLHWSDYRFIFHENPFLFCGITSIDLVFGPISIWFLWGLNRNAERNDYDTL